MSLYVKALIDRMAHHKMNIFHWHLTDDQGWRIDIASWPDLALIGGAHAGAAPPRSSHYDIHSVSEVR